MRQPSRDPVLRELPLPVERLGVRDRPRLDNLQHLHRTSIPLPRIAQRVATIANAMLSNSQTTNPRKPTRHAPTAASTVITPRCQIFSSATLRYQATTPPTPTAATRPATSGLPAVSWYTAGS